MKLKQIYLRMFILASSSIGLFTSCSSDDSYPIDTKPVINLESEYSIDRLRILDINPSPSAYTSTSFEWIIKSKTTQEDSITVTDKNLSFIALYAGTYTVSLKVKTADEIIDKQTFITVEKEALPYSAYLTKVYDFLPAVGQHTNNYPKFEEEDSKEIMIQKAEEAIKGSKGGMIHLGGFGGYVTFGFDHTIINVPGEKDFQVKGNGFDGNAEPGIILVSYDKNKNGLADDEWFEIAGSEHDKPKTIKNYEITYHKPKEDATSKEYVFWEDNQGNSGYKTRINNTRTYYPAWIKEDKITFKGTLLPDNAVNNGGMWSLPAYAWGYADNASNSSEASNIDIDWAVDSQGKPAKLIGVDFIKIYTGINQETGWLGEVSTEVTGAVDLHLLEQTK